MFINDNGNWLRYPSNGGNNRGQTFQCAQATSVDRPIMVGLALATVKWHNWRYILENSCPSHFIITDDRDPGNPTGKRHMDFDVALEAVKCSRKCALDSFTLAEDDGEYVVKAITDGRARGVCDGSFCPDSKTGSAAFIITDRENQKPLKGSTYTSGPAKI